MKKRLSKEDKKRIRKEAREGGIGQMAEMKTRPSASKAFKRKPYQTMSVLDYMAKKRSDDVE